MTIYNYHIYGDHIELTCPGSICTITDPEALNELRSWIKEADRWTPHNTDYTSHICNYLEIKINESW